ncbi:response regulator transcription factor [Streptomyces aurantiogriseus]|uniref:DNA-binding response regulator n=1 Tax=Streptomyces aurantiogriseus TaxID=66870 RepID=A0A918FN57_9ACTN|nr:response regulator transcription factor [Streptomyces aurantiogriseus]GGR58807.1 DNA-binding response regulator [Streptomyces aurantiogriseus]
MAPSPPATPPPFHSEPDLDAVGPLPRPDPLPPVAPSALPSRTVSSTYGSATEKPSLARGAGQHVLIVAGEPDLVELLATTLELAGYWISLTDTLAEALVRLEAHRFDLVVADTTLPDFAGVARTGRPVVARRPPVLYLAACDFLDRLLPELGLGEKDYVTKPFRVAEILARMQVLLRGTALGGPDHSPRYGDLVLDDTLCSARRGTRPLDLTPAEYRLLRHLLVNAHRVLSKEQISRYVWGDFRGDNAIEQLVSRLRRKVDCDAPALIHTRRGFGYWLGRHEGEG